MTALDQLNQLKDELNLELIEAPSELVGMAEALGYQATEEVQGVKTEFGTHCQYHFQSPLSAKVDPRFG